MKIKVIRERGWGYVISIKDTKKTTDLLEHSKPFEEKVVEVRNRYGFTPDWFCKNIEELVAKQLGEYNLERLKTRFDELHNECNVWCDKLLLSKHWSSSLLHFTAYNLFFCPEVIELEIGIEPKTRIRRVSKGLYIHVEEYMSMNRFKKIIDFERKKIRALLKKLPKRPAHNMTRFRIASEIASLKEKNPGFTYPEISGLLAEKYGGNEDLIEVVSDSERVKGLYHDWLKIMGRLGV